MAKIPNESIDTPADVHLPWIWARWGKHQSWTDALHRKAAHKALDIPEEEMIQANRIGVGGGTVAAIAVCAGLLPIAGMLLGTYLNRPAPAQPPTATVPKDSEYDVRFYDKNGNEIEVPHISKQP